MKNGDNKRRGPFFYILLEIFTVFLISFILWFYKIQIFPISSDDLSSILGTILQSSVTIIAILFSLLIFVGESYLGKYVSSSLKYVINNNQSTSFLSLYIIQIMLNIISLIYNHSVIIDVTITLFIICIIGLLPYYIFINKLFNPRRLIDEASIENAKSSDIIGNIRQIYQITINLIKNNEIVDARYGIEKIVFLATQEEEENKFNASIIRYLERIAVKGFDYDPEITETVLINYIELLNYLKTKTPYIVANNAGYVSSSCNKINKLTCNHLLSERSLIISFQLFNEAYVIKYIHGYDFSIPYELKYIDEVIKYMLDLEVEEIKISGGFIIQHSIDKLLRVDKDDKVYELLNFYIYALPTSDGNLLQLCTSILNNFPEKKKELAIKCIKQIKNKYGNLKIKHIITDKKTGSIIRVREKELKIESGTEEMSYRVKWFKDIFP